MLGADSSPCRPSSPEHTGSALRRPGRPITPTRWYATPNPNPGCRRHRSRGSVSPPEDKSRASLVREAQMQGGTHDRHHHVTFTCVTDVGFVRVGQNVEIKVDTFPFQKYGTIRGTLAWISPDAEDRSQAGGLDSDSTPGNAGNSAASRDTRSNSGGTQYFYRVHIKPERITMRVDGQEVPLTAGMTVKADIITDNRRVIEFFLSPVIKYLDEGLQVR